MCSTTHSTLQFKKLQIRSITSNDTSSPCVILLIVDFETPVFSISCFLVISLSISNFHRGLYENAKKPPPSCHYSINHLTFQYLYIEKSNLNNKTDLIEKKK